MSPSPSAVYTWDNGGLNVAIPKRRGKGYLKVPLGHHFVDALSDIEISEHVDLCGLDGYLQLEYNYVDGRAKRQEIVDRVMPKLAKHYGFNHWIENADLFWKIVQV